MILTGILLYFVLVRSTNFYRLGPKQLNRQSTVLNQLFENHLRDSTAVSDLPEKFGKFQYAIISRQVVTPSHVAEAIDSFTLSVFENPKSLGVLVADKSADFRKNSITITAGFSCVDRGNSETDPLQWWTSANFSQFSELKDLFSGPDGAETNSTASPKSTEMDITRTCLAKQINQMGDRFRLVEHDGIHDGKGVVFRKMDKGNTVPDSITLSIELFDRLLQQRSGANSINDVVYETETKIPIVEGLPFDTGVRILTHPSVPDNERSSDVRVPATMIMALRATLGARLKQANVDPGESLTSSTLVTLSVLATGLPLVIAFWLTFKYVSDSAVSRFETLKERGVRAVVRGNTSVAGIDKAHRVLVFIEILAGLFLLTPLAQAIIEGLADPRVAVEVTTGLSFFYGSSHKSMSFDKNNPIGGAPFVVLSWITVRRLDNGYFVPFFLSLTAVIYVLIWISFHELRRLSCTMPSFAVQSNGFSLWKLYGSLKMKYMSIQQSQQPVVYRVLIQFRDEVRFDNAMKAKVLLNATEEFREMSRDCTPKRRSRRSIEINTCRDAVSQVLVEHLSRESNILDNGCTFAMVAVVLMTNATRYATMMTKSKMYYNRLTRDWYYLLGGSDDEFESGNTIEYYRTMGLFANDKYLVAARLGLLEYLEDIKSIEIKMEDTMGRRDYDVDDIKVNIVETTIPQKRRMEDDRGIKLTMLRRSDKASRLLEEVDPSMTADSLITRRPAGLKTAKGLIQILFEM